mgnify:CR=1 FL=1
MKEKEKTYIDKSSFIERFVKRSIDFFFSGVYGTL